MKIKKKNTRNFQFIRILDLLKFFNCFAQRGEILYSRGNISSGKTVYIEL